MVEHPLFFIVASRKVTFFLFGHHAFSGEKRQQLVDIFSPEKAWQSPFMYYVNKVIPFFMRFP